MKGWVPSLWLNFLAYAKKDFLDTLDTALEKLEVKDQPVPVTITLTGSTLGGALSFFAGPLISKHLQKTSCYDVTFRTMTFGSACSVGNAEFIKNYNQMFPYYYNIYIPNDLTRTFGVQPLLKTEENAGTVIVLPNATQTVFSGGFSYPSEIWNNIKAFFSPAAPSPIALTFNRKAIRFAGVCIEDYRIQSEEIFHSIQNKTK